MNTEKKKKNGWKRIDLGGKMAAWIEHNWVFIIVVVLIFFFYIGYGFSTQNDLVEIENLKKELVQIRYRALNTTSDLSAKSKPSYIEDIINAGEIGLEINSEPPFVLPE